MHLDDGSTADIWTEWLHPRGAEVVAHYVDGPLPGVPAITRRTAGLGAAWYVATRLDGDALQRLVNRVILESGTSPVLEPVAGLEVVRRAGEGRSYLFLINHGDRDASVQVRGQELISGQRSDGALTVAAGSVAVVREDSVR